MLSFMCLARPCDEAKIEPIFDCPENCLFPNGFAFVAFDALAYKLFGDGSQGVIFCRHLPNLSYLWTHFWINYNFVGLSSVRQRISVIDQLVTERQSASNPLALSGSCDAGSFYPLAGQLSFEGR